jgi:hypothetical protein
MNPTTTDRTARPGTETGRASRTAAAPGLGEDLLRGAEAIAEFLFGDPRERRKVYYLTSEGRAQLPHFRLGTIICARKSTLVRWIEAAEASGSDAGHA